MTNIFLAWDRRKNCGGVKIVLFDPTPPPMCVVNGQETTNRLTVKIKLEKKFNASKRVPLL